MKNVFRILLCFIIFFSITNSTSAQTAGLIYEGTLPNTVLDPNGDGYVSKPFAQIPGAVAAGFPTFYPASIIPDILYSEIPYAPIPKFATEPIQDLGPGPDCFYTDMVPDANGISTYYHNDGTNMLFRFRLGGTAPNSKGYTVLIDTDGKFGRTGANADPNAVTGNLGFEIEIVLRTNFGVSIYNIDGEGGSGGTEIGTFNDRLYENFAIKSLSLTTNCNDPDYFYDFYVPFAHLTALGGGVTLTDTTPIRMLTLTSINPKRATGNNGLSDLGGTDDSTGEETINGQTPSSGDPLRKAACPILNSVALVDTSITGTTTEGNNAIIKVYRRVGATVTQIAGPGAASGLSVTIDSSTPTATWTLDNTVALSGGTLSLSSGDIIYATAEVTTASGTSTSISGLSDSDCSEKTITASVCTFPVITISGLNSGDKGFNGTLSASPPDGDGSYTAKIYNAVTGVEITNIDGAAAPYSATVTGTNWVIAFGGGKKVFSGGYTITMESAGGCVSAQSTPPFYECNSNPGGSNTASTVPTITDGTVLTTATVLNGGFSGGASVAAQVRLVINDGVTDLIIDVSPAATSYQFDISNLTLTAGDVLKIIGIDSGNFCVAESATLVVTAPVVQSINPTVTYPYCGPLNSITTISGTSEEVGATVTLYTADTFGGAKSAALATTGDATITVDVNGDWSVTTDAVINSGKFVFAKVQNTGETISDFSTQSAEIKEQTTFTTLVLTSDPITEGDASITGTSSGLATGTTIQLYTDDALIDGATTTTAGDGSWTISGLTVASKRLFTNAIVKVTATETGECESTFSNEKTVVCVPPAAFSISGTLITPVCEGTAYVDLITISATETGVIYQVFDQTDTSVGPSKVGTGAAMTISTDGLLTSVTDLKVKAYKIPEGSCSITTSTNVLGSIVVNPLPTVTLGANPSVIFDNTSAVRSVDIGYKTPSTGTPNQYKIVFDDADFTASNGGLATFSSLTTPTGTLQNISISIPLNKAVGVYTATFTIKEATNSCEKSYPITVTILSASAPTITLDSTTLTACSGSANLTYSATANTPTTYSIDYAIAANQQGFLDVSDVVLPTSPILVTVPVTAVNGTYSGVLTVKTAGSVISQEYAFTVSANVPTGGTVGFDQTVVNGNDVAAFTESVAATGTALTYQWQSSESETFASGVTDLGTSATYDHGNIGANTTYFRRVVSSTVNGVTCTVNSNTITVVSGTCPTITIAIDPTTSDPTTASGTDGKIVLSGLINNTVYSVSYQKDGAGAVIANYTSTFTTGKITINNLGAGAYTNIKVTYLSCDSNSLSKTLTDPAINTAGTPSSTPTLCINTALTNITHTTTGATGIANDGVSGANGLPTGVSASWSSNTITISGTPTADGVFNYSILLTGGAGTVSATGTITVSAAATVAAAGTDIDQTNDSSFTLAGNTATVGTGLWTVVSGTATITTDGSPISGVTGVPVGTNATLRWTITNSACSSVNDVVLTNNNSVGSGSSTPTLCINTALTNITHTTTGATGIANDGVSGANGLPTGVSASWSSNTITISGTPTADGVFNYSILLTGGAGTVSATGTITVGAAITIAEDGTTSDPTTIGGTDGKIVLSGLVGTTTYSVSYQKDGNPAVVANIAAVGGKVTIPTLGAGAYTNIQLTSLGCTSNILTKTLTDPAINTAGTPSSTPTLCINTALTPILIGTTGATGINGENTAGVNGLPAGVKANWSSNTITISGTPTAAGIFNYSILLTGGTGTVSATGTITVSALATVSNAGSPIIQIADASFTMAGNALGGGETGLWTKVSGSGSITTPTSNVSGITGVTVGTNGVFKWTITNGACTSESTVTLTNNAATSTDLSIAKTSSSPTPTVGSNVTFTLTFTNNGPSASTGFTVVDALPTGYTYVSDTGAGATSETGGTVTWTNAASLANGATSSIDIVATVLATGTYGNTATITASNETDSTPGNDSSTNTPVPVAAADLSIAKTSSSPTPTVGSNVTFTLTVTNNGPSASTGFTVVDALPTGYTYVSDTGAGATSETGGTVTWTNAASLANGATSSIDIVATVLATGTYGNTATITASNETDSTPGNDSSTNTPVPVAAADLSIAKTSSSPTPTVGSNVTFTLTVTNNGPSASTGFTVVDALPTGYTYVSDTGAGATSETGGTVTWTNAASLANGATSSIDIVATVLATGTYGNTATITASNETDSTPGNDSSTNTPVPVAAADLSIAKTSSSPTPTVGSNVTFTLTVTNNGPSASTGFTVVDALPTGYTYVSDTGAGATSETGGTVTWTNVASLANGATSSIDIVATVLATGTYGNTATITASNETDSTPGNDSSTNTPVPVAAADLSIAKTASSGTPIVGSNVTFTLTVTNNGPSASTGFTVVDALPTGYTYVSDTGAGATSETGGTVTWTNVASLANGATSSIDIVATVKATGVYGNTATITASNETDSTPGNDSSTNTPVPVAAADLSIAKTSSSPTPTVGSNVTFTLTVTNNGPSASTGFTVVDALPTGYTYVSDTGAGATSETGGTVTWTNVASLANGATSSIDIVATVKATGTYGNTATITASNETDSTPGNDSSTNTPVPVAAADLSIAKTSSSPTPTVGSNVTFTLTVTNNGPSASTGFTVVDALPTGYTYVSDTGAGATSETGGTVTWTNVASLANGATSSIDIVATVKATGTYGNTATITASNETDSTPGNDSSTNTPVPIDQADLSILKTDGQTTYTAGTDVVYTITVTNNGPSDAANVRVVDAFPAGITVGKWKKGAGAETVDALDDTTTTIANGATVVYTVTLSVPSNFIGNLTNTVVVTSDTVDPDPTCTGCTDVNVPKATSDVGTASAICDGAIYTATATAKNGTILWTAVNTDGTTVGSFANATIEDAVYTPSAQDILSGSVTLTMTVTGSANIAVDTVIITINPLPDATLTLIDDAICVGDTGEVTLSNSVLGVSYQLRNNSDDSLVGTALVGTGGNISFSVSPSITTTYNVLATNATSCSAELTDTSVVTVNSLPDTTLLLSDDLICNGSTGSVILSNSVLGVSYQLRNNSDDSLVGTALVGTGGNISFNVSPLTTTTYNILATNATSCSAELTDTTTVTVKPTPAIVLGTVSHLTTCLTNEGSIELTGLTALTDYIVSYKKNGTTFNPTIKSDNSGNVLISSLSSGDYTDVSVQLNGCTSNVLAGPITINEPAATVIAIDSSLNPTTCSGSEGFITLSGLENGKPYAVSYKRNGVVVNIPALIASSGKVSITNLNSGNYSDISVSASNCTSNVLAGLSLADPAAPTIVLSKVTDPATCAGKGSVEFSGLLASTLYTINFTHDGVAGSTTSTSNGSGILEVANLDTGLYENISVVLANCVSNTIARFVINPPTISLGSTTNPTTCSGFGEFEITGLVINAPYNVSYTFNGAVTNKAITSDGSGIITVPNLIAGSYSSITVETGGCTSNAIALVTLTAPASPVITLGTKVDPTSCIVGNGSIQIDGLLSNASYVVSYELNGNLTSANLGSDNSGSINIINLVGGSYTKIKATSTITNCSSNELSTTITNPAGPTSPVASNQEFCGTGTISNLVATVDAGSEIKWYLNANGGAALVPSEVLSTRTYYAEAVSFSTGCSSTRTAVAVTINALPATPVAIDQIFCGPKLVSNLVATVGVGEEVKWYTAAIGGTALASTDVLSTGTYYAAARNTTTDCYGARELVNITIKPTPVIALSTVTDATTCSGTDGSIKIIGLDLNIAYEFSYKKNGVVFNTVKTSSNIGDILIDNLSKGSYTDVQITLNGCVSNMITGPITIDEPVAPTIGIDSSSNPTTCGATDGEIVINGLSSGTNYAVSYERNGVLVTLPSETAVAGLITIPGLTSGSYDAIKVATVGCESNVLGSLSLNDPSAPTISIDVVNHPATCSGKGSMEIITVGSSLAYTINYTYNGVSGTQNATSDGSGRLLFTNLDAGLYENISVTLGGCTSNTITRGVISPPVISLGDVTNPATCSGVGTIELLGLVSNVNYTLNYDFNGTGVAPYILASDSNGELVIPNLTEGSYTNITVTDTSSCVSNAIANVSLIAPNSPVIGLKSFTDLSSCLVNDGKIVLQGLSAGTAYEISYKKDNVLVGMKPTIGADNNGELIITGLEAGAYTEISAKSTTTNCVSNMVSATLNYPLAPDVPVIQAQSFCDASTIGEIAYSSIAGVEIKWFAAATGGTQLSTTTAIATTTTYYAEATSIASGCISSTRTPVVITINSLPAEPVINDQTFCGLSFVSDLTATPNAGEEIKWYLSAIGGTALNAIDALSTRTYYAEAINTTTGCVSVTRKLINVIINKCSDLDFAKSVDNDSPKVNEIVTFTLTINNNGPDNATGVAVEDNLPTAGFEYVAGSASNGGSFASGKISWNSLTVTSAGLKITYQAKVKAPDNSIVDQYKNTAQITASDSEDPDSDVNNDDGDQSEDDEDGFTIGTPKVADLSLDKSVSDSNPNVGDELTFTLELKNSGPDIATNVAVEDVLPKGYAYVQNSITGNGTYDAATRTLSWSGKTIAVSGSEEFTYKVIVNAPTSFPVPIGEYKNTAQVTASDQYDPNSRAANDNGDQSEDDEAAVSIDIQVSDLKLTKLLNTTSASVGDVVTFTLSVQNFGPSTATNVSVIDHLPVGFEYVTHRNGTYDSATGIWLVGSIANASTSTLELDVRVLAPTGTVGEYTNVAEVNSSDQFDPDSTSGNGSGGGSGSGEDDDDKIGITLLEVDLAVSKTVNIANPVVNSEVIFTIKVDNNGLGKATNIKIEESLPSGYNYVSHQASKGSYDGFLNWNITSLANGESATLAIVVTVNESGPYLNTASVISVDQVDSDSTNDSGSSDTTPLCLTIYNEFSPNGDGVNDLFRIDCIDQYPNNVLEIFNRWGNTVYKKKGYDNTWNGTSTGRVTINTGKKLPVGTYYYVLDLGDGSKPKKGWIYINR